jgi:uncharacterized protein YcfJ
MKKLAIAFPVLMLVSMHGFASEFDDYATVKRVDPQVVRTNHPRQECTTDYVTSQAPQSSDRSLSGAVIGGLTGAILGNQVGGGRGKTAATAVGAVTGAIVGDRVQNGSGYQTQDRPVQRCHTVDHWEQHNDGYKVTYEYMGHRETTILPYDPGSSIRVHVAVSPQEQGSDD